MFSVVTKNSVSFKIGRKEIVIDKIDLLHVYLIGRKLEKVTTEKLKDCLSKLNTNVDFSNMSKLNCIEFIINQANKII